MVRRERPPSSIPPLGQIDLVGPKPSAQTLNNLLRAPLGPDFGQTLKLAPGKLQGRKLAPEAVPVGPAGQGFPVWPAELGGGVVRIVDGGDVLVEGVLLLVGEGALVLAAVAEELVG